MEGQISLHEGIEQGQHRLDVRRRFEPHVTVFGIQLLRQLLAFDLAQITDETLAYRVFAEFLATVDMSIGGMRISRSLRSIIRPRFSSNSSSFSRVPVTTERSIFSSSSEVT